jgi:hypothetical protein
MKWKQILFLHPLKNQKKEWEQVSEEDVNRFIDDNIPVYLKRKELWDDNPTWGRINPKLNQLNGNKNEIPNEWWIWYSDEDVPYYGFVLKNLVYYPVNERIFIDFREYHDFQTGYPLIGPSQNFSILKNNEGFNQESSIRNVVPIIASAKLIAPYIVQFHNS